MLLKWLHVQCPWIYQNRAPLPIFLHRVTYIPMPLWTFFGSKSGFFEMIVKIAKKKKNSFLFCSTFVTLHFKISSNTEEKNWKNTMKFLCCTYWKLRAFQTKTVHSAMKITVHNFTKGKVFSYNLSNYFSVKTFKNVVGLWLAGNCSSHSSN